jgi:membrane-bound hydrogenase subunit mbhJ
MLQKYIAKSPWVFHVNTGGCNGCDIEILAALTPRYDAERFGVKLVGSPRHADVLLVAGPVTHNVIEKIKRIYEQTPDPKLVIAIGACSMGCSVFQDSYCIDGPLDEVIPVHVYVPGCPPRPEAILKAVLMGAEALPEILKKAEKGELPPAPDIKEKLERYTKYRKKVAEEASE